MTIRCASSAHLFCRDVGRLLRSNLLTGKECKFVQGRLCKLALGPTNGSIVHHLWLRYSPRVAAQFLSDRAHYLSDVDEITFAPRYHRSRQSICICIH